MQLNTFTVFFSIHSRLLKLLSVQKSSSCEKYGNKANNKLKETIAKEIKRRTFSSVTQRSTLRTVWRLIWANRTWTWRLLLSVSFSSASAMTSWTSNEATLFSPCLLMHIFTLMSFVFVLECEQSFINQSSGPLFSEAVVFCHANE